MQAASGFGGGGEAAMVRASHDVGSGEFVVAVDDGGSRVGKFLAAGTDGLGLVFERGTRVGGGDAIAQPRSELLMEGCEGAG